MQSSKLHFNMATSRLPRFCLQGSKDLHQHVCEDHTPALVRIYIRIYVKICIKIYIITSTTFTSSQSISRSKDLHPDLFQDHTPYIKISRFKSKFMSKSFSPTGQDLHQDVCQHHSLPLVRIYIMIYVKIALLHNSVTLQC